MIWVFVGVGAVLVLGLAYWAVFFVSSRLTYTGRRSLYDLDEATDHVADRLPDRLAGKLTHDDVQAILWWRLEYLRQEGIATFGRVDVVAEEARAEIDEGDVGPVVADDDMIDHVLARAEESGRDIDAVDVVVVLDLEVGYLREIGALGDEVDG